MINKSIKKIINIILTITLIVLCIPATVFATEYEEDIIWQQDEAGADSISWSGKYRFCNEDHSTGEEIAIISNDDWNLMKEGTFYLYLKVVDGILDIRVTTGWWSADYGGVGHNCINDEGFVDNGDGYYTLEITLSNTDGFVDLLDDQHMLFTGSAYIPLKIFFKKEKEEVPEYNVDVESESGFGSVDIKDSNDKVLTAAKKGEIVYLEAKPQEGYTFDSWELVEGSISIDALKNKNPITLRMPEENIKLKANFVKTYNINLSDNENGKAFSLIGDTFKKNAKPGDTVQLCVAANDGYAFSKWEVSGVEINNNTSVMPENDVNIKAIFEVPTQGGGDPIIKTVVVTETKYIIPKTGIK